MQTDFNTAIQNASWVVCPAELEAPIIRRCFHLSSPASAEIAVSALGFFKLYVNGSFPTIDLAEVVKELTDYALPRLFADNRKQEESHV